MRVAFIAHSSLAAGTEAALCEAVGALRERGVDARIVLPAHGPLSRQLSSDGFRIAVVPYTWWMGSRTRLAGRIAKAMSTFAAVPPLVWLLRRWRPDVVVSWSITIVAGAFAARLLRIPHVWILHESGLRHHGLTFDWGQRLSCRIVRGTADAVIAASQAAAEEWVALLHVRPRVIYQSVTPRETPERTKSASVFRDESAAHVRSREHPPRFVVIGGAAPGKSVHEAIRALAACPAPSSFRLTVLGSMEGRNAGELRSLTNSLGVAERVEFAGWVDDVRGVLAGAAALVAPSRDEGFGRAVVEAMLAGVPVIGARSGATPELLNGGGGLLYEPGDVSALAALMAQVANDPRAADALGQMARSSATERFGRERFGRELEELLNRVAR